MLCWWLNLFLSNWIHLQVNEKWSFKYINIRAWDAYWFVPTVEWPCFLIDFRACIVEENRIRNIGKHVLCQYLTLAQMCLWVWLSKPTNRYTTPIYKHEYIYIVTWPVNVLCSVYKICERTQTVHFSECCYIFIYSFCVDLLGVNDILSLSHIFHWRLKTTHYE